MEPSSAREDKLVVDRARKVQRSSRRSLYLQVVCTGARSRRVAAVTTTTTEASSRVRVESRGFDRRVDPILGERAVRHSRGVEVGETPSRGRGR